MHIHFVLDHSRQSFQDTVVNQALTSLYGGSLQHYAHSPFNNTSWSRDGNSLCERTILKKLRFYAMYWTSKLFLNHSFFTERTNFSNKYLKKLWFFSWKKTKQFYSKNNFTEGSFSEKINEIDEKLMIILRRNEINEKKKKNGLFTNDVGTKWKKNWMRPISSFEN